jgi:hypothetical protein
MKYADVTDNVRQLPDERPSPNDFIHELLLDHEKPKTNTPRLKQGTYNQSKAPGEGLWKKEVWLNPANVSQASSLPSGEGSPQDAGGTDFVSQASSLPSGERSPQDAGGTDFVSQAARLPCLLADIGRAKPFASDEERLEHLFALYEKMTAKEKLA